MEGDNMITFVEKKVTDLYKTNGYVNIKVMFDSNAQKCDAMIGVFLFVKIHATKNGMLEDYDVVVKCAPRINDIRRVLPTKRLFKREILYYSKIAPIYDSLQDQFELCVPQEMRCMLPKCLGTCDDFQRELLIFENLKSKGYSVAENLDYDHAKIIFRAVGKLHALSLIYKDRYPKGFEELVVLFDNTLLNSDEEYNETIFTEYGANTLKHFAESIVDENLKSRLLQALMNNCLNKFKDVWKRGNIKVLMHGDLGLRNFFFKYKNNKPVEAIPIDFQWCRYGSVGYDLMYFFAHPETANLRRNHFVDILNVYYRSLKDFLLLCGYGPNEFCSYEDFKAEIKSQAVTPIIILISCLPFVEFKDFSMDEALTNPIIYTKLTERQKALLNDLVIDWASYGFI